jgi:hypothetical protein
MGNTYFVARNHPTSRFASFRSAQILFYMILNKKIMWLSTNYSILVKHMFNYFENFDQT